VQSVLASKTAKLEREIRSPHVIMSDLALEYFYVAHLLDGNVAGLCMMLSLNQRLMSFLAQGYDLRGDRFDKMREKLIAVKNYLKNLLPHQREAFAQTLNDQFKVSI
jgi:hypothetical protein